MGFGGNNFVVGVGVPNHRKQDILIYFKMEFSGRGIVGRKFNTIKKQKQFTQQIPILFALNRCKLVLDQQNVSFSHLL